jgi:hypothetical protein
MGWIHLAQDTVQWRVAETVLNHMSNCHLLGFTELMS